MKKICFVILSLLICGCSAAPQEETKENVYKDGSYTSTAQGYGGDFEVETTMKDDHIVDIVAKEHNETPSIGGVAIEQIISQMKEKNSYRVDVVSGATKTSQALIDAVKQSIEKAKNDTK